MIKILLILLTVVGCNRQTANDYNQKLSTWLGRPERLLIQKWGQPVQQFDINQNTYALVFMRESRHGRSDPYSASLYYPAMSGPRYGHSMIAKRYYCQTTFSIRNGIVVDYSFIGDDCI